MLGKQKIEIVETMEAQVIANNNVKHSESEYFNEFLRYMERKERAELIKEIAFRCGVNRTVVYSWKYMCCRIPEVFKPIIESCAGCRIFPRDTDDHEKEEA